MKRTSVCVRGISAGPLVIKHNLPFTAGRIPAIICKRTVLQSHMSFFEETRTYFSNDSFFRRLGMTLEEEIRNVFSEHPEIIFGFADISYCTYKDSYSSALVFAVPYGEQLIPDDYTEERFEHGIQSARATVDNVVMNIEDILRKYRVKYWIPPVAQENETELRALFSFKTAAAYAGIGWFGKNDVIITERYGPRVRLSDVLIDEIFEYGKPIDKSRCPDDCTKCIDICPCKALKNHQWTINTDRSEMIDYQKCNQMRSAFIQKLGRKNACGLCLAACPFGQQQ